MGRNSMHDSINNQFGNPKKYNGEKGSEKARNQTENYNCGARVPYDLENSRDVAKRRDALLPSGPVTFPLGHVVYRLEGFPARQMITMQLSSVRPLPRYLQRPQKEDAEMIPKVSSTDRPRLKIDNHSRTPENSTKNRLFALFRYARLEIWSTNSLHLPRAGALWCAPLSAGFFS
jgi:hypothetical protein